MLASLDNLERRPTAIFCRASCLKQHFPETHIDLLSFQIPLPVGQNHHNHHNTIPRGELGFGPTRRGTDPWALVT